MESIPWSMISIVRDVCIDCFAMAQRKKRGPKVVTAEHKAAMAVGRNESRAVRAYLEALEAHKPKRGRKRTPESVERRLATIEAEIDEVDPITRVNLVQERLNLQDELEVLTAGTDLTELEDGFVGAAKGYSHRRGISYSAWREVGVEPTVLKRAGITRRG
jgi:uncharacterized protein YdcH (DUF465 family)